METSNQKNEKQVFSFSEVACQLGISVEELINFAKQAGLFDENGLPTEFAISEGLLGIMPDLDEN